MAARTKFKTCFTLTDDALRDQHPQEIVTHPQAPLSGGLPPPRKIFRLSHFPEGRISVQRAVLRRTYLPLKAHLATGLISSAVFVFEPSFRSGVFERLFWNRCPRGYLFSRWPHSTIQHCFRQVCSIFQHSEDAAPSPRLKRLYPR